MPFIGGQFIDDATYNQMVGQGGGLQGVHQWTFTNSVVPELLGLNLTPPDGFTPMEYRRDRAYAAGQFMGGVGAGAAYLAGTAAAGYAVFGTPAENLAKRWATGVSESGELMGKGFGFNAAHGISRAYGSVRSGLSAAGGIIGRGVGGAVGGTFGAAAGTTVNVGGSLARGAYNSLAPQFMQIEAGATTRLGENAFRAGTSMSTYGRGLQFTSEAAAKSGGFLDTASHYGGKAIEYGGKALTEAGAFLRNPGMTSVSRFAALGAGAGAAIGAAALPIAAEMYAFTKAQDFVTGLYERHKMESEADKELKEKSDRILGYGKADESMGLAGGMSVGQRQRMVSVFKSYAETSAHKLGLGGSSYDPFTGMEAYNKRFNEVKNLFGIATDAGMFDNSRNMGDIEQKFKNIVEQVDKLSRVLKKGKEDVLLKLKELEGHGFYDPVSAGSHLSVMGKMGQIHGISDVGMMQLSLRGSQAATSLGINSQAGAELAVKNVGNVGFAFNSGILSEKEIRNAGGREAIAMTASTVPMSLIASDPYFKSRLARIGMISETDADIDKNIKAFTSISDFGKKIEYKDIRGNVRTGTIHDKLYYDAKTMEDENGELTQYADEAFERVRQNLTGKQVQDLFRAAVRDKAYAAKTNPYNKKLSTNQLIEQVLRVDYGMRGTQLKTTAAAMGYENSIDAAKADSQYVIEQMKNERMESDTAWNRGSYAASRVWGGVKRGVIDFENMLGDVADNLWNDTDMTYEQTSFSERARNDARESYSASEDPVERARKQAEFDRMQKGGMTGVLFGNKPETEVATIDQMRAAWRDMDHMTAKELASSKSRISLETMQQTVAANMIIGAGDKTYSSLVEAARTKASKGEHTVTGFFGASSDKTELNLTDFILSDADAKKMFGDDKKTYAAYKRAAALMQGSNIEAGNVTVGSAEEAELTGKMVGVITQTVRGSVYGKQYEKELKAREEQVTSKIGVRSQQGVVANKDVEEAFSTSAENVAKAKEFLNDGRWAGGYLGEASGFARTLEKKVILARARKADGTLDEDLRMSAGSSKGLNEMEATIKALGSSGWADLAAMGEGSFDAIQTELKKGAKFEDIKDSHGISVKDKLEAMQKKAIEGGGGASLFIALDKALRTGNKKDYMEIINTFAKGVHETSIVVGGKMRSDFLSAVDKVKTTTSDKDVKDIFSKFQDVALSGMKDEGVQDIMKKLKDTDVNVGLSIKGKGTEKLSESMEVLQQISKGQADIGSVASKFGAVKEVAAAMNLDISSLSESDAVKKVNESSRLLTDENVKKRVTGIVGKHAMEAMRDNLTVQLGSPEGQRKSQEAASDSDAEKAESEIKARIAKLGENSDKSAELLAKSSVIIQHMWNNLMPK